MDKEQTPQFEEMMEALDAVVKKLSAPNVTLTEAMELFEKGVYLCGECEKTLTEAEQKIMKITQNGTEPFSPLSE